MYVHIVELFSMIYKIVATPKINVCRHAKLLKNKRSVNSAYRTNISRFEYNAYKYSKNQKLKKKLV